jgi:hypothetical protein
MWRVDLLYKRAFDMIEHMNDCGLPEELEVMAPGPELFSLLAAVDRRSLSETDRVRLARARNRLASHVQGELVADLYAVTWGEAPDEEAPGRHPDASRYPWAEVEVAFALTWTRTAAALRLEQARQLLEDLPRVWKALRAGELDVPKVLLICELASWLEDSATARAVVDRVLDRAAGLTTGQLRARLRRLVLAVDPDAARRRCATAVATRRVEVLDNHDSTGELWGRSLPPQDAAAAWERLTAIARAAKSAGDVRSIDQLRADALLDLLVGEGVAVGDPVGCHEAGLAPPVAPGSATDGQASGSGAMPAPRRGVVELQVPLTTLLDLTQLPGDLNGFGPVVADIARQVAAQHHDGTWRFSVYNEIGHLLCHGTTAARPAIGDVGRGDVGRGDGGRGDPVRNTAGRRPTAEVAALVRARNRTCVAPGCRQPSRTCDLDHTVDWARGGASDADNLGPQCRLHHRFKHGSGAHVTQIDPGVFVWWTPRGLQYLTTPDPPLLDDDLARLLTIDGGPSG